MTAPGKLITLEGIDRSGKSLQADRIAKWLEDRDKDCVRTSEPEGSTEFGRVLRSLLLDPGIERSAMTAAMLFSASRHEHVASLIAPALAEGKWVVCDRFIDSTLAYQGGGDGLETEKLKTLCSIACGNIKPVLTILLNVDPGASSGRDGKADYYDNGDQDYLSRVADRYRKIAESEPERFAVIDASLSADEVSERIYGLLERLLED